MPRGFLGAHAGQRLVQQQRHRLRGQAHRHFELALLAMGEFAGQPAGVRGQAGAFHGFVSERAAGTAGLRGLHSRQARCARDCAASRQFSRTVSGRKMLLRW